MDRPATLQTPHLAAADVRPRLLIFANCQGQEMADAMRNLSGLRDRVEVIHVEYHTLSWPNQGLSSYPDFGAAPTLLWDQVTDASFSSTFGASREELLKLIPRSSPVIRFPPFTFSSLWPFEGADERHNREQDEDHYLGSNRYYFTDRIAQSVAAEPGAGSLPDSVLYEKYMERFAAELPRLNRRLNFDKARMETRDALSDIAFTPFILDNFRDRRLFQDSMHVAGPLLREVLHRLVDVSASILEIDAARAKREIDAITMHHQGQLFVQAPINPLVSEHFGLRYGHATERTTYAHNLWTFRQYIVNYMRWRPYMF